MPSIRVRPHSSYASLHQEPDSALLSPRSLASSFTGPPTPGSITRPPRPRPSLPVLQSGEEVPTFRTRSNTGLSRVQSRVFRDSLRNSRSSTFHGSRGYRGSGFGPPKAPHRSPIPHYHTEGATPQHHERTTDTDAAVVEGWTEIHHDDIVEHLDVIDPQVGTVSTLTNAANSIIIPPTPFYDRKPVITLPATPREDGAEQGSMYGDALDRHVDDVIRRPSPVRRTLLGICAFLKTPMGIITGIYGFLVVFWGAAIVLFLARIINLHDANLQGFWVEVSSQVVNGLFTATSIGFIPFRAVDTYRIYKIWHYKRRTIRLRKLAGLPQLFDPDDLPDPNFDDNYVRVLTDKEQKDLHRQQLKFQYHQTWYRAHGGETHRAFPINIALAICFLNDANSVFQIILCGTMWGLNRFERPAWSTGTLIPAAFLCGIGAAILIWRGGEKTKRVEEIRQKLREALAEIPSPVFEDQTPLAPVIQSRRGTGESFPINRSDLVEMVNSSSEKLTANVMRQPSK